MMGEDTDIQLLVERAVPRDVGPLPYESITDRVRQRRRRRRAAAAVCPLVVLMAVWVGLSAATPPDIRLAPAESVPEARQAPDPIHAPEPRQPDENVASGLAEYRDDDLGIVLHHPIGWTVSTMGTDPTVVRVASPDLYRDGQARCGDERIVARGVWLQVLPDPLGLTNVDAPDSRPAAFDLAHADDVVAACGERAGRWSFTYLQAGQQVTATVEIGPESSTEDVQAVLAVLDSVTLEDRRPGDQRALVALQLEQAHDTMTEATWRSGGMRSWARAVEQLATAVAAAREMDDSTLLAELERLHTDAAAVLHGHERLVECDQQIQGTQDRADDPAGYDACIADQQASTQARADLHDRLVNDIYPLVDLVPHEG